MILRYLLNQSLSPSNCIAIMCTSIFSNSAAKRPRQEGNVRRMRNPDDDDDDESATWNGNSTQQLWYTVKSEVMWLMMMMQTINWLRLGETASMDEGWELFMWGLWTTVHTELTQWVYGDFHVTTSLRCRSFAIVSLSETSIFYFMLIQEKKEKKILSNLFYACMLGMTVKLWTECKNEFTIWVYRHTQFAESVTV